MENPDLHAVAQALPAAPVPRAHPFTLVELLPQYIRLLIATVAATGSCFFVICYTKVKAMLAQPDRSDFLAMEGTRFLALHGWHMLVIPLVLLLCGIVVVHRWKNKAAFELVVGSQWLFAFLWLAWCILICLVSDIPLWSRGDIQSRGRHEHTAQ